MAKESGTPPGQTHLTLTEITKGPKNINKGRQVEAVMEEEESAKIQQPQPEGEASEL